MSELLLKLILIARAVVLYKEPHRSVTAIEVHVLGTFLKRKRHPVRAFVRTPIEADVRIDERKHEFCVKLLHQLKAQLPMEMTERILRRPAKRKESRQHEH